MILVNSSILIVNTYLFPKYLHIFCLITVSRLLFHPLLTQLPCVPPCEMYIHASISSLTPSLLPIFAPFSTQSSQVKQFSLNALLRIGSFLTLILPGFLPSLDQSWINRVLNKILCPPQFYFLWKDESYFSLPKQN